MPKDSDEMVGVFATETPNTPRFSSPDDQFPRYVGDDIEPPYPSNIPMCTPISQASQRADADGADEVDEYNPFFPPNLPVDPFSSPGRRNKPIYVLSSPPQLPIVISSSPPYQPAGEDAEDAEEDPVEFNPSAPTIEHAGPWFSVTRGTETGVFRGWDLTTTFVTGVESVAFTMHMDELDAYETYINAKKQNIVSFV
ncbi:hypothetical protein BD410DRAFT_843641 [Rickenella mellea]|uniref:Uncharacterized protein n=1 Tax=Rickenella mellea TaxID=50990 RepID=A0A4Y7PQG9_9AGAM|nr:hypothetical protein BD410DRAFT_843641 [Rickenella mellea]